MWYAINQRTLKSKMKQCFYRVKVYKEVEVRRWVCFVDQSRRWIRDFFKKIIQAIRVISFRTSMISLNNWSYRMHARYLISEWVCSSLKCWIKRLRSRSRSQSLKSWMKTKRSSRVHPRRKKARRWRNSPRRSQRLRMTLR